MARRCRHCLETLMPVYSDMFTHQASEILLVRICRPAESGMVYDRWVSGFLDMDTLYPENVEHCHLTDFDVYNTYVSREVV